MQGEFDASHMARALELAARGEGFVEPNPMVGCTIVRDGETGFLVPARDSRALAEAVLRLLRDKKLRREMGERGYIMLTTSLSLDAIAAKTREVYQNAISSRNDAAMPRRHH